MTTRDPLAKSQVGKGTRQFWAGVFLLWGIIILVSSMFFPHIEVSAFLGFGSLIGSTFILGLSVDSAIKTKAASNAQMRNQE